ncbi:DUF2066 domain-containing protein [Methylophaga sp. OBS4]|uniref:DUF2066 domain-containing protein n=1 Tax=Methylophaga sp. OBS4 TaxID=2991935 RepID=UPI002253ADF2|nr:DUF2066 domain-containing protein [Methylophaga sp. OBS4]MCX4188171.1 DUF2066 domain-containing protein [Methylophaga sp. OBS4]
MHRLFFALILLSLTCGSHAAEVNNLYQSQTSVSSRDEQERDQLTPQLLREVILKVVGNRAALDAVDLTPILSNSGQYRQQYQYERMTALSADLTRPDDLALVLTFNANSVNQALKDLGLPIWGAIRPDVLVWIALEQANNKQVLGLENVPQDIINPLNVAADKRGLPLLLPLMDLQDQAQLTFNDIWTGDDAAVQSASQRYGADVLLTARVTVTDSGSQIRWQADINGERERWQSQGDLTQAIQQGIGVLADRMARRYTQVVTATADEQRLVMQITDVNDYADFSRLMAYLNQLEYITDIRVINLSEQKLDLDIAFNGNWQVLQRTLSVGRMLLEENSFDSNNAGKHYRLLP